MGVGNKVLEMAEQFNIGDHVKILPNKGYGVVTGMSPSGFIFLNDNNYRPYLPCQLEITPINFDWGVGIEKNAPVKKAEKQKGSWYRFWHERPHPLADEDTPQDFFFGILFAFCLELFFVGWLLIFLWVIYSV